MDVHADSLLFVSSSICLSVNRVRETLSYAADLRLPRAMTEQKKQELVELVLLELGLKDCAETRVGDPGGGESGSSGIRGISGGERRRVSAGIQLLTNPKMLLCDELTSGKSLHFICTPWKFCCSNA